MFSKKPVVKTFDTFKKSADNALSVFRQSYKDLIAVNNEIRVVVAEKEQEIMTLKEEQKALSVLCNDNSAVAVKIGDILGEETSNA